MSSGTENRRNQVMLGELPNDFLRLSQQDQAAADERIARILQAQQQAGYTSAVPGNVVGRLNISIVQAKLAKNYGLTKMDPYCRIRVGHTVFETPTEYNGAKNPRWNKTIQTFLLHGVEHIHLEIFDEHSFTMDDRIAWAHISIPEVVKSGETVDEWFPLSGRQGDEKEGMVNLVFSLTPASEMPPTAFAYPYGSTVVTPVYYPPPMGVRPVMAPMPAYPGTRGGTMPVMAPAPVPAHPGTMGVGGVPMYPPGQQPPAGGGQPVPAGPLYTEEDLRQVRDMFPNMEEEVVKSVLEANRGNKDQTINSLLAMSED